MFNESGRRTRGKDRAVSYRYERNPKLTPLARCITARQDSGISNRKGEHSGVLITGARAILTPERLKVRQCGRRFKGPDEPMYALTTQDVHGVILLNGIIRRLMPIECFRLQGFADNQFQTLADNGISDSQLYKWRATRLPPMS